MMKKFLYILASVIVIIIIATLWRINTHAPDVKNQEVAREETRQSNLVTLIFDFPEADDKIITQPYIENQTAFELLLASQPDIEYKEYDFGVLITAIEGLQGGTDNKYWIYYVNNEVAQVGASDYILNPGDVVTWYFEDEKKIHE